MQIRNYGRVEDALPVPDLLDVQRSAYNRFIQASASAKKRRRIGLEGIFREGQVLNARLSHYTVAFSPSNRQLFYCPCASYVGDIRCRASDASN